MNRDILVEYAEIKKDIRLLEEKLKAIQPEVLTELTSVSSESEVVLSGYGSFKLAKKRNWKYSGAVDAVKAQLDDLKTEEEQLGTATYTETEYVVFRGEKEE